MKSGRPNVVKELEQRKRREREAHDLVVALVDNTVSKEFFLNSLKQLTVQHYEDVTVERSLTGLCGYCLCDKNLNAVPQQKYKIVRNRVYDISARKLFCSSRCYAASCKISEQISSVPLWLRETEKMPDIEIFDDTAKVGDEVILRNKISKSDITQLEQDFDEKAKTKDDDAMKNIKDLNEREKLPVHSSIQVQSIISESLKSTPSSDAGLPAVSPLDEIRNILNQWISQDSYDYLYGRQKTEKLETPVAAGDVEELLLNKTEFEGNEAKDDTQTDIGLEKSMKKYEGIVEDAKKYENKVSGFFGGALEIKERQTTAVTNDGQQVCDSEIRVFREKLVLDKLKKFINDLTPPLPSVYPELRSLVGTLTLTSKNVMARTELWPVLTVSILYLLAVKVTLLDKILCSRETGRVLQIVLQVFNVEASSLKKNAFEILSKFDK